MFLYGYESIRHFGISVTRMPTSLCAVSHVAGRAPRAVSKPTIPGRMPASKGCSICSCTEQAACSDRTPLLPCTSCRLISPPSLSRFRTSSRSRSPGLRFARGLWFRSSLAFEFPPGRQSLTLRGLAVRTEPRRADRRPAARQRRGYG